MARTRIIDIVTVIFQGRPAPRGIDRLAGGGGPPALASRDETIAMTPPDLSARGCG